MNIKVEVEVEELLTLNNPERSDQQIKRWPSLL